MKKRRNKLTMKQKEFVNLYTDKGNKETFGNGLQSAKRVYNVSNDQVAQAIASENLLKPLVSQAIEKKIMKKEDIQHKVTSVHEKIDSFITSNDITPEIVGILKENREYLALNAKLNGDLQERMNNNYTQINIYGAVNNPFNAKDEDGDIPNGGGGEG